MDKIKLIGKNLKDFFNEKADVLAISSGFIKRKRKLKGSCFAKALIIGSLGDLKSIESLCHLLGEEKKKSK
jgi:hypothetical protein